MSSYADSALVSASLSDQHEDDACCDVQTTDGTGDPYLHIETLQGSQTVDGRVA